MSLAGQRFRFHKYFCHAVSDVFIIDARRLSRPAWYGIADFTDFLEPAAQSCATRMAQS